MNILQSLKVSSVVLASILGTALVAGCTITTTPVDPPLDPVPTPVPVPTPTPVVSGSGCDFGEPNDTRETATPIAVNTMYSSLCVGSTDATVDQADFFELTAPAGDNAGGLVSVQVSNVQNGGLAEIIVTAVADNGVVFDAYTTDQGGSVGGWLSVTPGAKYRIQVSRFGGTGDRFAYDLFAKYTAIVDAYEPNNTKDVATPIGVNAPISASPLAHSPNANLGDDDVNDWYTLSLAGGTASIVMSNVPADYRCDVQLLDASGASVAESYQTTEGANCRIDATDLAGGAYFVKVSPFSGTTRGGGAAGNVVLPAFATQSYQLLVQQ